MPWDRFHFCQVGQCFASPIRPPAHKNLRLSFLHSFLLFLSFLSSYSSFGRGKHLCHSPEQDVRIWAQAQECWWAPCLLRKLVLMATSLSPEQQGNQWPLLTRLVMRGGKRFKCRARVLALLLLLLFFVFWGPHKQCRIQVMSAIYTTAHGNAGSFNPLSEARDRTCVLMPASQIRFRWVKRGTPLKI